MLGFIVEIIGEEAAAKLIARFGGTRLYVPTVRAPTTNWRARSARARQ